jgi:predicted transcriptional regulator
MPRREWSRPFAEIKILIMDALADPQPHTSAELAERTGLPLEDVISALRMLRHGGVLEFEPEWESEGVLRAAHNVRLVPPSQDT